MNKPQDGPTQPPYKQDHLMVLPFCSLTLLSCNFSPYRYLSNNLWPSLPQTLALFTLNSRPLYLKHL